MSLQEIDVKSAWGLGFYLANRLKEQHDIFRSIFYSVLAGFMGSGAFYILSQRSLELVIVVIITFVLLVVVILWLIGDYAANGTLVFITQNKEWQFLFKHVLSLEDKDLEGKAKSWGFKLLKPCEEWLYPKSTHLVCKLTYMNKLAKIKLVTFKVEGGLVVLTTSISMNPLNIWRSIFWACLAHLRPPDMNSYFIEMDPWYDMGESLAFLFEEFVKRLSREGVQLDFILPP